LNGREKFICSNSFPKLFRLVKPYLSHYSFISDFSH
jgi:hypothetical protein